MNGITTFSTGQYKTAGLPFDWPNLGAFSQSRPDQVGNPYPAHQTFDNWLNVEAFIVPGCPTFNTITTANSRVCSDGTTGSHVQGNSARNSLEMPGINNWDFSITKDTKLTERFNLQFRAEFFNGWNHTQFGDANTGVVPGQFGRIASVNVAPREVQFALRLVF